MAEASSERDGNDAPPEEERGEEERGSLDVQRENYVQVLDPQTDTDAEQLTPALWGRFWGMSEGNAVAFYWVFNPDLLSNSEDIPSRDDEPDEPDSPLEESDEDGSQNGNHTSGEIFEEDYYAVFGDPASLETYDPGLTRGAFKKRLLDYTIADVPVPKVALEDISDTLEEYLEKPKVVWLEDFIRSNETSDINSWFSRLLEELQHDEYRYQLRAQLIDPDAEEQQLERKQSTPADENKEDEAEDENSARILDISLMTDPTNGVEAADLLEGMEIYFRIVGNVDFLPEKLIDRDRQEPASTPMTGSIVSIERNPEIPGDQDADPGNYSMLEVEIEPEIHGQGLVFKDDRVKIPIEDDDDPEFETRDIVLLVGLVGVLLLILILLLSL